MGRLIDIDAVRKAIEEEWDGCCADYNAQEIIDDTIHAVEQVEEVEAIPVDWFEKYIDGLHSNSEVLLVATAHTILKKWREEQEKDGKSN